ncbi:hypothetical protein [Iningainema tapete]|uniref:Uncharacterized protein n=1 Tax=Iningainema tapete BLCC-T55 TaxID=2748662 RepID=A0A8J6XDJ1_9CYAN|nr:hypothetical protein [Iningainema tapete]MBD2771130.1 hypothetical protein [Iningainema tapete BLCC-T55]
MSPEKLLDEQGVETETFSSAITGIHAKSPWFSIVEDKRSRDFRGLFEDLAEVGITRHVDSRV